MLVGNAPNASTRCAPNPAMTLRSLTKSLADVGVASAASGAPIAASFPTSISFEHPETSTPRDRRFERDSTMVFNRLKPAPFAAETTPTATAGGGASVASRLA